MVVQEVIQTACGEVVNETVKKSPLILLVAAVGGTILTAALAVKSTPKALEALDDLYANTYQPTKLEVIKTAAPCYLPAALSLAATVACYIWGYNIQMGRYELLLAGYGILEEELARRNDKIIEYVGPRKAIRMDEEIANEKRRDRAPVRENTEVLITDRGNTLCYDTLSGRYFRMDKPNIIAAINTFNDDFLRERDGNPFADETTKELNDLYLLLGLKKVGCGNLVTTRIINYQTIFGTDEAENGEPCITMDLEGYAHYPGDISYY